MKYQGKFSSRAPLSPLKGKEAAFVLTLADELN